MSPTLAEHLYDDRKARDCEGELLPDLAPDDRDWDAHLDDFSVFTERAQEGFDFSECEPLPTFVEVVIDRQVAEREAARVGYSLPWGTPILKLDAAALSRGDFELYEVADDAQRMWPDGEVPGDACLRYPTKTDRRCALDWGRIGLLT